MSSSAEELSQLGLKPWVHVDYEELSPLWFENIDGNAHRLWSKEYRPLITLITLLYALFFQAVPLLMSSRKPFNVKRYLAIYNFLLAAFSIFALCRLIPEILHFFFKESSLPQSLLYRFHYSTCIQSDITSTQMFWGTAFVYSTMLEYGITAFLVFKKRKLSAYRCARTFAMVWATFNTFNQGEPFCRWVCLINYGVHAVMYSYYFFKSLDIQIPKRITTIVNSCQLMQCVAVLGINLYTFMAVALGADCHRTFSSLLTSFVSGGPYVYFYLKLWYNRETKDGNKSESKAT